MIAAGLIVVGYVLPVLVIAVGLVWLMAGRWVVGAVMG